MGYTKTAVKGISWLTAARFVTRGFSFLKVLVVARFLTPSQFGLFGIAALVLSFVEVVTETGVNVFLVQQKGNIDKYLGTALLVSIIRGTIISIAILLATPFVAAFFNAPDSRTLLYTMSMVPFMRGFINPSVVKFQKDLLFRKEFIFRSSIIAIEIAATLFLLYIYRQPVALIWGIIVGVLLEVVLSYVFIKPRPRIEWDRTYLSKVIHSGKWVTSFVILNFGFEKGDDIIVGRLLGTTSLGLYDMAYKFSLLPITELVNMVIRVVFPVYVKISDDYKRLRNAYLKTTAAVALAVVPFGTLVIIFPDQIIEIFLGEKWIQAADVFQILAILGVVRAITYSSSAVLLALKMQKKITITTLVAFLGMGATVIPFISNLGLIGAAYAATTGYLLSVPFIVFFTLQALNTVKESK